MSFKLVPFFTILFGCTLILAVPHHRIRGEDSKLDDEIQRDSLSQELIRTKKSVDSSEIEEAAKIKAANEIEKRSSQGSSALWAQTTLKDVEMDGQKNEDEAKEDVDRSRRQYSNCGSYPIEFNVSPEQQYSSYASSPEQQYSSYASSPEQQYSSYAISPQQQYSQPAMRSAATEDAQLQNNLGDSSYSAKTFSLHHQSILPMVHQPITHGYDEALPIYKPVKQVVQQVIQPIQPVIQPVVHPVQQVIQPVYQQIEPIYKPPVYQPIYHAPIHLPSIHQSLPLHHHPLPMLPQLHHTPMCPCPLHLLGAGRSSDGEEVGAVEDQTPKSQIQGIAMFRDASQSEQGGSSINDESRVMTNLY